MHNVLCHVSHSYHAYTKSVHGFFCEPRGWLQSPAESSEHSAVSAQPSGDTLNLTPDGTASMVGQTLLQLIYDNAYQQAGCACTVATPVCDQTS